MKPLISFPFNRDISALYLCIACVSSFLQLSIWP
uniref:Uncharacterized protein n=1 Tax=Rhizophora mucronata TaxID=61149 RepID=A0A2P2MJK9_RHIMU